MKAIITTFNLIKEKDYKMSSSLHDQINIANERHYLLRDLLTRELDRFDLGKEVGSLNYVTGSNFYFAKTKALQPYSFLPIFNSESTETIIPHVFIDQDLKAGDVILSKDSNIGEVIILDKDYPNYMLSGALYKLPLRESDKFYLLACIKHRYFREQLDRLVPKGATLRHAGTKFLDCKIPFPANNKDAIVEHVSHITQKIIEIEIEIKHRYREIDEVIETELRSNENTDNYYKFAHPTYNQLLTKHRLDTGVYSDSFKRIMHLITNYKFGVFYIDPENLKSGNTPKNREIAEYKEGDVRWLTPTNCSDLGFIQKQEKISTPSKNNLVEDAVLLINRTSRGGKGEYVGIGTFYDYGVYGEGYHNQGIYRVTGYDKKRLVFMTAFMNTKIMRKYCAALSVGSKMKEIKSDQFLSIPFPLFKNDILNKIYELFYTDNFNRNIAYLLSLQSMTVGLFHLSLAKDDLMKYLNSILDMIADNIDFNVVNNKIIL